ncbi:uncharacterized protein [Dysidea avara]|uniref:uncharacterized protein isoform X1 n=1 Tax=Dysidea avara TaxID=196820 RepID=UPI0033322978
MPIHVATLSVTSPEPLSVNHQIYCTPDRSFLQFSVTSHWPQGVKLCEEQLSIPNGASSEAIQVPVPEILSNEENFSYLWEIQRLDLTVNEPLNSKCSFDLSSQLIMDNDMGQLSVNHSYPFTLPAVSVCEITCSHDCVILYVLVFHGW